MNFYCVDFWVEINTKYISVLTVHVCLKQTMQRVAIIGTSGRDGAASKRLTSELFDRMVAACHERIIEQHPDVAQVCLVSGGAAWADHVAVELFLTKGYGVLELCLPCGWDGEHHEFTNLPTTQCASTANSLHRAFSRVLKRNTLQDISRAQERGAILTFHNGFLARNNLVARTPWVIALTFGKKQPDSSGTTYTWVRAQGQRTHLCLGELT